MTRHKARKNQLYTKLQIFEGFIVGLATAVLVYLW